MKKRKIGLVLGSGSARGFAHIGVLSVLEKHNIRPDFVAGTSVGAAVGALYCSGMSPEQMKRACETTEWQALLDFGLMKTGMLDGNKFEEYIQKLTNNVNFQELRIPLRVVATDIDRASKVVFSEGNVAKAVRASISIPGVFSPVKIDNHHLVDGALIDPIPVDEAREMGADFIIAVDVTTEVQEVYIKGSKVTERSSIVELFKDRFIKTQIDFIKELVFETVHLRLPSFIRKYVSKIIDKFFSSKKMYRLITGRRMPQIVQVAVTSIDIMSTQLARQMLIHSKVDFIITPDIKSSRHIDFEQSAEIIRKGEEAAERAIPKLKKLLRD
jgi:NTE family protein